MMSFVLDPKRSTVTKCIVIKIYDSYYEHRHISSKITITTCSLSVPLTSTVSKIWPALKKTLYDSHIGHCGPEQKIKKIARQVCDYKGKTK